MTVTIRQVLSRPIPKAVLLIAVLVVFIPSMEAGLIVPSALVSPGGPSVGVPLTTQFPGTLLASLLSPFSFSTTAGTTSGDILSAVYRNGTGTLDFYYQVINNANSATSLALESDTSFTGFVTAVAFRLDGGSLAASFTNGTPGIIPVTADRDLSGSTVDFSFIPVPPGTKIPPSTTSAVLIISTNATAFTAGNAEVIDGGTVTVASFQPLAAPVPEPTSIALMGVGLMAFAGIRRLRFGR